MPSLGDYGTPHDPFDDTFGWFGADIRVHPDLSDLVLMEFAQATLALQDSSELEALSVTYGLLHDLVHPDDYDQFMSLAKRNRQTIDDLVDVAGKLVEAVTDRPTERPSTSSPGRPSTATRSAADSSLRVQHRLEEQGRADLAVFPYLVREAASA